MFQILESFLTNRKQRVIINGLTSEWVNVEAGVPQGSVLGPLLFLIYINDLSESIKSEVRMFADDTFIFHVETNNRQSTVDDLDQDLRNISQWANQWKMSFNPDITKQAVEVIFSRKKK